MHCETLLFYGPIGKVIFDNIPYKTRKSKLIKVYMQIKRSLYHVYAHDFFFVFFMNY